MKLKKLNEVREVTGIHQQYLMLRKYNVILLPQTSLTSSNFYNFPNF